MRFLFRIIVIAGLGLVGLLFWASPQLEPQKAVYYPVPSGAEWTFQSIDTMKYSRDRAREELPDALIERQMNDIAKTGATHVAIATPYDEEFVPELTRWVGAARQEGLSVWFRGNWSGWEGWFGYQRIGRDEHLKETEAFILGHPDLFKDGDVFSSCPECENGGPGDPRRTGDVAGYRRFLIAEYQSMTRAFQKIHRDVRANFFSMNGDVARLIMDKETTKALGGIVTIDHYVKTPEQLAKDVDEIASKSGGRVVLGEFGAPIPDIHGDMKESAQAGWVEGALRLLKRSQHVIGMSYWLSVGGSTEIWTDSGRPREAVGVLTRYFRPKIVYGFVRDELGRAVVGAQVSVDDEGTMTDKNGYYVLKVSSEDTEKIRISKQGFSEYEEDVFDGAKEMDVTLIRTDKDWRFRLLERLKGWKER